VFFKDLTEYQIDWWTW